MTEAALTAPAPPRLFRNARLATMRAEAAGLGIVEAGAVATGEGRIVYAGLESEMPARLRDAAHETHDCEGRWITPGLVDCHTHLVYAGHRGQEFAQRLEGVSYAEIARAGGGIGATVSAVRSASEAELLEASLPRLDAMLASGATTVEVKSGYGLNLEHEGKMLRTARALSRERAVSVFTTYLGAHAVAPEFEGDGDGYIAQLAEHDLPALVGEGLVDAVDAFCEYIGCSPKQTERVFAAAAALGIPVKLHADQLSNLGGAALAARWGALSADHLEYTDREGIHAMVKSETVPVLLPGAFHTLRETQKPPVEHMRFHKMPMAVATDCNPGSSPLVSLPLAMNLAATLFGMTVNECLLGTTRNAARALGRLSEIGTLDHGKHADLAVWSVDTLAELVFAMGGNPLHARVWHGHETEFKGRPR